MDDWSRNRLSLLLAAPSAHFFTCSVEIKHRLFLPFRTGRYPIGIHAFCSLQTNRGPHIQPTTHRAARNNIREYIHRPHTASYDCKLPSAVADFEALLLLCSCSEFGAPSDGALFRDKERLCQPDCSIYVVFFITRSRSCGTLTGFFLLRSVLSVIPTAMSKYLHLLKCTKPLLGLNRI